LHSSDSGVRTPELWDGGVQMFRKAIQVVTAAFFTVMAFCGSGNATVYDWTFGGGAFCGGGPGCAIHFEQGDQFFFYSGQGTFTTGDADGAGFDITAVTGTWRGWAITSLDPRLLGGLPESFDPNSGSLMLTFAYDPQGIAPFSLGGTIAKISCGVIITCTFEDAGNNAWVGGGVEHLRLLRRRPSLSRGPSSPAASA
jgi:hypothetical protein